MKEAVAALDAAGHAFADNGAGMAECGRGGRTPRRVMRMDQRGRGAGGYLVAQFDQRLEEPGIGRIDIILRATHLHDPGLCRGWGRLAAERPDQGQHAP